MLAYDFEYDSKKLSDFNMIICKFGGADGVETISNGNQITFNTVPVQNGSYHRLTSAFYEECLTTTVQICRNTCNGNGMEIDSSTFRELTRWLNRKKFLKLKFLSEDYIDLYYKAAMNISRIEIDGKLVGVELNITTNSPHAYHEPKTITIKNTKVNGKHSVNDTSYEEGYIYPYMEITLASDGDLKIYNAIEDRWTNILNCTSGEVIIMDYPIIQSSDSSHDIQNNFNWKFFRIANTYENSRNDLTISLPCTIKLKYSPIVKVGL